MAALAAFTMLGAGTALDNIWNSKEHGYHQMLHHRIPIGLGLKIFVVLLALAAIGFATRRPWGWLLGVLIFTATLIADLATSYQEPGRTFFPSRLRLLILLTRLIQPRTRSQFPPRPERPTDRLR